MVYFSTANHFACTRIHRTSSRILRKKSYINRNAKKLSSVVIIVLIGVFITLKHFSIYCTMLIKVPLSETFLGRSEQMTPYVFKPKIKSDNLPKHLDQVSPWHYLDVYGDGSPMSIDEIHLQGLVHFGMFMFFVDINYRVLFIHRSPKLVTCPNTWMPPGEHFLTGDVHAENTLIRGVEEEFGEALWNEKNHFISEQSELTSRPVYFYRDYGPSNGGRVDRQLTHFWYIQLTEIGEIVAEEAFELDEENNQVAWYKFDEIEQLTKDNPDSFCHQTIISFIELGVSLLKKKFNM